MKNLIVTSMFVVAICSGCAPKISGTFSSPERAGSALLSAARDQDAEKLNEIFGAGFVESMASGDPISDRYGLSRLAALMEERTDVASSDDNSRILELGKDHWPFPVPLVKRDDRWMFDTTKGADEILTRRIGENELRAIKVAHFYADAQKLYHSQDRNGDGVREYARRFVSTPGTKDGLFWPSNPQNPEPSPFGPLIGLAVHQGYSIGKGSEDPLFRGYHYRILTAQGPKARSGAKNYLGKDGRMTRGFGLLIYPATWGNSGVMTFMVGPDGQVYESNLGPDTEKIAAQVRRFNPDKSWRVIKE